ncbi:MAG TPA: hypothetical protein VN283_08380 [Thiobacillus sp.]|nr:hypothetical protein [Thiobacillus sp.]
MKTWFITLPFLCAVGVAMANGVEREGAAGQTEAAAAPDRAQTRDRMHKRTAKRLPTGDLRHCLDLKTSEAIIRCSETRRK